MDETSRKKLVADALAEANQKPDTERTQMKWREQDYRATVVSLPVDGVVLNPKSHRIRAQLESSKARDAILSDPFSDPAQAAIAEFLRQEEHFQDLKRNLRDSGQLEPGVVTADGMLVNANTRCVALRDNGDLYIRVAVLPADADQREVDRLELSLQMKRDFRSDYTFTNELLFVDDLIKTHKYQPENVAAEMGWASLSDKRNMNRQAEKVRQYQRILVLIRELQYMSGERLPLVQFDARRQALTEIDDDTDNLRKSDKSAADEMRDARLSAMLLDVGYRELREINRNFIEDYLVPAMEERSLLKPHVNALTMPAVSPQSSDLAGLDIFDLPDLKPIATSRTARIILEALTDSVDKSEVVLKIENGEVATLHKSAFRSEMKSAFEGAAEDVRLNKQEGDELNRPIELIRKAQKQIGAAIQAYTDIKSHPDFEHGKMSQTVADFEIIVGSLKEAIDGSAEAE